MRRVSVTVRSQKSGSTQSASHFRTELKDIIKNDRLPDYRLALDESSKPNQLVYMTRDNKRLVTEANRVGKLSWVSGMLQQSMDMSKAKAKPKTVA